MKYPYFIIFLLSYLHSSVYSQDSEESNEETTTTTEAPKADYGIEIPWSDANSSFIAIAAKSYIEPAGYEGAAVGATYLCRAFHTETWVPGKQVGNSCYITKKRAEHRFEEFQVPSIPSSLTSWRALSSNKATRILPNTAVIGGEHWDAPAYICRGYLGRILGPGIVVPGSYHPVENICYLAYSK